MIVPISNVYRESALASSNLMLRADSRKALGRYEEAAQCYLEAGQLRRQMGDLQNEAGDFDLAAEDWLSAAACFLEGTAPETAAEQVRIVRCLKDEGRISEDRHDLLIALQQRANEVAKLGKEILLFLNTFDCKGNRKKGPVDESVENLMAWRKKLPGFWRLHWAIFHQASLRNEETTAAEHLRWAATFNPTNPNLTAVLGLTQVAKGQSDKALELAKGFLNENPGNRSAVRIMMASALLENDPPNSQQALAALQPLTDDPNADARLRLLALAWCAGIRYELGEKEAFQSFLDKLPLFDQADKPYEVRALVDDIRKCFSPFLTKEEKKQAKKSFCSSNGKTRRFEYLRSLSEKIAAEPILN